MEYKVPSKRVDAAEFCRLAVSRRNLQRADNDADGIRGLFDPVAQVRYVITESQLFGESTGHFPNAAEPSASVP